MKDVHGESTSCLSSPCSSGETTGIYSLKEGYGFRLFIKTYGCQANVYDSQRMEWALRPLGFIMEEAPQYADVVVINTCHIRLKAEEKLFSDLGRLRSIKEKREQKGQSFVIVVAGCVGQALGHQILKRAPFVDVLVGPQTYHTLPETMMKLIWEKKLQPQALENLTRDDNEDHGEKLFQEEDGESCSSTLATSTPKEATAETVYKETHKEEAPKKELSFSTKQECCGGGCSSKVDLSSNSAEKKECCGGGCSSSDFPKSQKNSIHQSMNLVGTWSVSSFKHPQTKEFSQKSPQDPLTESFQTSHQKSSQDSFKESSPTSPQESPSTSSQEFSEASSQEFSKEYQKSSSQKQLKKEKKPLSFHTSLGFPKMDKFDELPQVGALKGPTAFLSIQEGCNKFCRFCVVPYVRGPEYSRSPESVLQEAHHLVACGAKEITLLGQNVNAYHGQDEKGIEWSLGRLLFALCEIPGLLRLRYTTSHPRDMHKELYEAHRDLPQVMPFLHLPVQSGSDKILAHMNRKYTHKEYLSIIEECRSYCPNMGFSSDFIVGYPGETEKDFEDTMNLVQEVGFAQGFSFKYSPRPGTPAATMKQVEEKEKNNRLERLQHLLNGQRLAFNNSFLHQELELLLEYHHRETQELVGRSPFMQPVHLIMEDCEKTSYTLGDIVQTIIVHSSTNTMIGKIIKK